MYVALNIPIHELFKEVHVRIFSIEGAQESRRAYFYSLKHARSCVPDLRKYRGHINLFPIFSADFQKVLLNP